MAAPTIDVQPVIDEIAAVATVLDSVIVFINESDALREKAVRDAIAADDAGDQGTADAAVAAMRNVSTPLKDKAAAVAAAILAHTPSAPTT